MGKVSGGAGRNRPAGFTVAARRAGVATGGNPDQAQAILAEVQRMERAGLLRTVTRADGQRAQDRASAASFARRQYNVNLTGDQPTVGERLRYGESTLVNPRSRYFLRDVTNQIIARAPDRDQLLAYARAVGARVVNT